MKLKDFLFELPEELIAQYPKDRRDESRLFVIDRKSKKFVHKLFKDIVDYIPAGDVLVLNDTRVNPWRFYGKKTTGARIEILLLKEKEKKLFVAIGNPMKRLKKGDKVIVEKGILEFEIIGREGEFLIVGLKTKEENYYNLLEEFGHIPLPPYIRREDNKEDKERYQTIYARKPGAIAAPTAGLHFTEEIFHRLKEKGIKIAYVTLHVGIGTFKPIKTENIIEHKMHSEEYEISDETAMILNDAIRNNHDIWAVGTTTVRTLESAISSTGEFYPGRNTTDLYIYPGYNFKSVNHIITNFHLPGSSLVVMISAFVGREILLDAYQEAISLKYRFFSYGDAMLIL